MNHTFPLGSTDLRITLITEKPNTARVVARVAHDLWPNDTLEHVVIWPTGVYTPPLPRGLRWKDYPFIAPFEEDSFIPRSDAGLRSLHTPLVSNWNNNGLHFEEHWEKFEQHIMQADRLICIPNPKPSVYHFEVLCQKLLARSAQRGNIRLLSSLDRPTLWKTLQHSTDSDKDRAERLIQQGRVRRYFDYQFTLNSLAVFGAWLGQGGGWVSKYQLQLLYALRNQEPTTLASWWTRMHQWRGTGKYCQDEYSPLVSLGSTMSIGTIFEQVIDHGWVHKKGDGNSATLSISHKGITLLDQLHPRCEDSDLPYRLQHWALMGLEKSRAPIDRYIRTLFGRQKSFMKNRRPHHP